MSGEKTEQPTPKRLREARKKGQAARSREAAGWLLLAAFGLAFHFAGASGLDVLRALLERPFDLLSLPLEEGLPPLLSACGRAAALLTLPVLLIALIAPVLGNAFPSGLVFSLHPAKPDWKRLDPAANAKRLLSPDSLFDLLLNAVKVLALAGLFARVIAETLDALAQSAYALGQAGGRALAAGLMAAILRQVFLHALLALGVLAAADLLFRRHRFGVNNRMSKEEVKREYKETEGDPLLKARRRQLQEEILEGGPQGGRGEEDR